MKTIIYDSISGEILRIVDCPENMRDIQAQPTESMLVGEANDDGSHYVVDGALVAYTLEQAAAKAARPLWAGTWSNMVMAWNDPRNLDEHKLAKWIEIREMRNLVETQGFPYISRMFDSDSRSVQRINTAVQAAQAAASAGQPFDIEWTVQDNTSVVLDTAGMIGMPVALATYANGLHEHAKGLRVMIEAATTQAEIEAINWETEVV